MSSHLTKVHIGLDVNWRTDAGDHSDHDWLSAAYGARSFSRSICWEMSPMGGAPRALLALLEARLTEISVVLRRRLHVPSAKGGAVEIRRVSKLHVSGQLLSLDALLVTPTIEKAWQTRQAMTWDFGSITVVSREGLVALKSLRGSGRDQDDIKQLRGETE